MTDCTIYRRRWSWACGNGVCRGVSSWFADCPVCGPLSGPRSVWGERYHLNFRSRKVAKDALHRHRVERGH